MIPPPGIDEEAVGAWFATNVAGSDPPLSYRLIAGGHSNLTFEVTDRSGHRWVLRRPPLGHLLPTAHDMAREHRILSSVHPTEVPVPQPVALCIDADVNGAPFYVMEAVDGTVLRDVGTVEETLDLSARRALGLRLVDTLAEIHSLDPTAIGLGDLGRPEDYIARQLRRWKRQLDGSRTPPLAELYRLHDHLAGRIPEQVYPGLVHGDFRLDNCIVGEDAAIRAVLDWELCTQGDTMADVGLLMVYWSSPADVEQPVEGAPSLATGFPSRGEMLERYADRRGIVDLSGIEFYTAFSYWRLACITEGVYARYLSGAMGDRAAEAAQFERRVGSMVRSAEAIVSA